jgi:hypothetical protein
MSQKRRRDATRILCLRALRSADCWSGVPSCAVAVWWAYTTKVELFDEPFERTLGDLDNKLLEGLTTPGPRT